ncbi:MAG: hypothetical protein LBL00_07535 [Endomicrobium sp.]|nr:hypothetical protein [Endomicrobium sp.]
MKKNWKIVVAVVVAIVAVVANVVPGIGNALSFALGKVAGFLFSAALVTTVTTAAAVIGMSAAVAASLMIGVAVIAVGAIMYGAGRAFNVKWLIEAGVIVMAAGAIITIASLSSWASSAIGGGGGATAAGKEVMGTVIKEAAKKTLKEIAKNIVKEALKVVIKIAKAVAAEAIVSTGVFFTGRIVHRIGVRNDSDFLKDFGNNIGGNSWKIGFIWGAVGWEDGHFGFSKGWGINLGTFFIGNQTFRSFEPIKLPDGSEGIYEKTIKGFNISIPIGNINLGFSCIYSYDNIYGERWNIGVNIGFGGNSKLNGFNFGFNMSYQEKDPYFTGQQGWTFGSNVGWKNMQIGASYNFTSQTVGVNLTYNFGKITNKFLQGFAGVSIGGSYSFKYGDVSFNAGVRFTNGSSVGYSYSEVTDAETGMRYVRKGVSISFDLRKYYGYQKNGKGIDDYAEDENKQKIPVSMEDGSEYINYGSLSFSVTETKTYDKYGNLLDTSVTPSANMYINIEQLTSYISAKRDQFENLIALAPTLSSIISSLIMGFTDRIFGITRNQNGKENAGSGVGKKKTSKKELEEAGGVVEEKDGFIVHTTDKDKEDITEGQINYHDILNSYLPPEMRTSEEQSRDYYKVDSDGNLEFIGNEVIHQDNTSEITQAGSMDSAIVVFNSYDSLKSTDKFEIARLLSRAGGIASVINYYTAIGVISASSMNIYCGSVNGLPQYMTITNSNIQYYADGTSSTERSVNGKKGMIDPVSNIQSGETKIVHQRNGGAEDDYRVISGVVYEIDGFNKDEIYSYIKQTSSGKSSGKNSYVPVPSSFITSTYDAKTGEITYINISDSGKDGKVRVIKSSSSNPAHYTINYFTNEGSKKSLFSGNPVDLLSVGEKLSKANASDIGNIMEILSGAGIILPNITKQTFDSNYKNKEFIDVKYEKGRVHVERSVEGKETNTRVVQKGILREGSGLHETLDKTDELNLLRADDIFELAGAETRIEYLDNKGKVKKTITHNNVSGGKLIYEGGTYHYASGGIALRGIESVSVNINGIEGAILGKAVIYNAATGKYEDVETINDKSKTKDAIDSTLSYSYRDEDGNIHTLLYTNMDIGRDKNGDLTYDKKKLGEANKFENVYDSNNTLIRGEVDIKEGNWIGVNGRSVQATGNKGYKYQLTGDNKGNNYYKYYDFKGEISESEKVTNPNGNGEIIGLKLDFNGANVSMGDQFNNKDAIFYGYIEINPAINQYGQIVMGMSFGQGSFISDVIILDETRVNELLIKGSANNKNKDDLKNGSKDQNYHSLTDCTLVDADRDGVFENFSGIIGIDFSGELDFTGNEAKYRVGSDNTITGGEVKGETVEIKYNAFGKWDFYSISDKDAQIINRNGDVSIERHINKTNGSFAVTITSDGETGTISSNDSRNSIDFDEKINIKYVKDKEGKWVLSEGSNAEISAKTFKYRTIDAGGKESVRELDINRLEYKITGEDGQSPSAELWGQISTGEEKLHFGAPGGGDKDGVAGKQPDASDTKANIKMDLSGAMDVIGDISLRGLSLVVLGEGATATAGSILLSNGNLITTADGNYTMVNNRWMAGEYQRDAQGNFVLNNGNKNFITNRNSSYTYNEPLKAAEDIKSYFKSAGYDIETALNMEGKFTGNIPVTCDQALVALVARDGTTINATVNENGAKVGMQGTHIALEAGTQVILGLSKVHPGELGIFNNMNSPLQFTSKLFTGIEAVINGKNLSVVNLEFNHGDEFTLGVGLTNAYDLENTKNILTNSGTMNKTIAGIEYSFDAGEIKISIENDGSLSADFYQNGENITCTYRNPSGGESTFVIRGTGIIITENKDPDLAANITVAKYGMSLKEADVKLGADLSKKDEAADIKTNKPGNNGSKDAGTLPVQQQAVQVWDGKSGNFIGETILGDDGGYSITEGSTIFIPAEIIEGAGLDLQSYLESFLTESNIFKTVGNVFFTGSDVYGEGKIVEGNLVLKAINSKGESQWAAYGIEPGAQASAKTVLTSGRKTFETTYNEGGFVGQKETTDIVGTKSETKEGVGTYVTGTTTEEYTSKLDEETGVNVKGAKVGNIVYNNASVVITFPKNGNGYTGEVTYRVSKDGKILYGADFTKASYQYNGETFEVSKQGIVKVPVKEQTIPGFGNTTTGYQYYLPYKEKMLEVVDILPDGSAASIRVFDKTHGIYQIFTVKNGVIENEKSLNKLIEENNNIDKNKLATSDLLGYAVSNIVGFVKDEREDGSFDKLLENNHKVMLATDRSYAEKITAEYGKNFTEGFDIVNSYNAWDITRSGKLIAVATIDGQKFSYELDSYALKAQSSKMKWRNVLETQELTSMIVGQGNNIVHLHNKNGYDSSIVIRDNTNISDVSTKDKNILVYYNGKKGYISEGDIVKEVRVDNGKYTSVEKNGVYDPDINVKEYYINGDISASRYNGDFVLSGDASVTVVEIDLEMYKRGWLKKGTAVTFTETHYDSIRENAGIVVHTNTVNILSTASEARKDLYAYGKGTFTGTLTLTDGNKSIVINVHNEGTNQYSTITSVGNSGDNYSSIVQCQTVTDRNTGMAISNGVYEYQVETRPKTLDLSIARLANGDIIGQSKTDFDEIVKYYQKALENGNANVLRASVQQYNDNGSVKSSFEGKGRAYVDGNGTVQALFVKDPSGQSMQIINPSFHQSVNRDMAANFNAKNSQRLSIANSLDGNFGDIALSNLLILQYENSMIFAVDVQSGRYFSAKPPEVQGAAAYMYADNVDNLKKGESTNRLGIIMTDGGDLKISLATATKTREGRVYSHGESFEYSAVQQTSISHSSNGSVNIDTFKFLGNGKIQRNTEEISLMGERTENQIFATAYTDGVYMKVNDDGTFTLPSKMVISNEEGERSFSRVTDRNGKDVSYTAISGTMDNIVWNDDNQMIRYSPVDYKQTVYTPSKTSDSAGDPYSDPSGWVKGNTTELSGGTVHNIYSKDDIEKSGVSANLRGYVTFPDESKNNGEKVSSYFILDGVTEKTFNPKDVLISQDKKTTVEQINEARYSTDGINYKPLGLLDSSDIYSSRTTTEVLYSNVINSEVKEGKLTGVETEINTTAHTRITTNYYEISNSMLDINGTRVSKPSVVSETVTSAFVQNSTRYPAGKENANITTNIQTMTSVTGTVKVDYADGSSRTDRQIAVESRYSEAAETKQRNALTVNGGRGTITTEYGVNETIITDKNGKVTTDRTAERATVADAENGRLLQESTNTWSYSTSDGKIKEVFRENGRTVNYEYNKDGEHKLTTVMQNSSSHEVYNDERLVYSYADTGDYAVIGHNIEITRADGTKYTADGIIKYGRDITEENYNYKKPDGTLSSLVQSSDYTKISYDYIGGTVSDTKGHRTNTYREYDDGTYDQLRTTDSYEMSTYILDKDLNYGKLARTEKGYTTEYNIKVVTNNDGTQTRTSNSQQYSQVSDYENDQFYINANTDILTSTTIDFNGDIVDKKVSGVTKRWDFESAEKLERVNFNNVVETGGYGGTEGKLNANASYAYTNTGYSYDNLGRETGYDFERTYFEGDNKGKNISGRNTTEYVQMENGSTANFGGGAAGVRTSYESQSVASDGKVLDANKGYYANNGLGNTSSYKSMESSNIVNTSINNIAANVMSDAGLIKDYAQISIAQQRDIDTYGTKVLIGALAAVATVAITVVSFGSLTALVGVAWAVVGSVLGGLVSVVTAVQSSIAAYECARNGDWGGFTVNVILAALSIVGAKGLNSVIGKFGSGLHAQIAIGAAKRAGKKLTEEAFKKTFGEAGKKALEQAAKEGAKAGLKEGVKKAFNIAAKAQAAHMSTTIYVISSAWGIRAGIAVLSTAQDLIFAGSQNWYLDLARVFSVAQLFGMGGKISENSWVKTEIFGIRLDSIMWITGYVIAPGMISQGIRGAILGSKIKELEKAYKANPRGFSETVYNKNLQSLKAARAEYSFGFGFNAGNRMGEAAMKGLKQSASNIGQLIGRGVTAAEFAAQGSSRLNVILNAWGGVAVNMYRMALLNIGMNITGKLINPLVEKMPDSALSSLLNFVFQDMGKADSIFEIDLATSALFGAIMYVAMPIVQGLARGLKGKITSADKMARKAAGEAAESAAAGNMSAFKNMLNAPKALAAGIWEEGFKENIVQAIVTPFVGANVAEYISEFAFPGGSANILDAYMVSVQNVNHKSKAGATRAANGMRNLFNASGYSGISAQVVQNANGSYGIIISGLAGAVNARLSNFNEYLAKNGGGRIVASLNSEGQLELEAQNFKTEEAGMSALLDAQTSIGRMGIDVSNYEVGKPMTVSAQTAKAYEIYSSDTFYNNGFTSKQDMQNFMIGVYNAVMQFTPDTISFEADGSFAAGKSGDIIEANISKAAAIKAKTPNILQAFWNGDTRTSSDILRLRMNAANIMQKYGMEVDKVHKFDINKFSETVENIKTQEDLEIVLKDLTDAIAVSVAEIGLENFFTENNLQTAIEKILSNTTLTKTQAYMQIAQFGAMLAQNGLANAAMMETVAQFFNGSSLESLGITTIGQVYELGIYLEMIKEATKANAKVQASTSLDGIISEITNIRTEISKINEEMKGNAEERLQIIKRHIAARQADTVENRIMLDYLTAKQDRLQKEQLLIESVGDTILLSKKDAILKLASLSDAAINSLYSNFITDGVVSSSINLGLVASLTGKDITKLLSKAEIAYIKTQSARADNGDLTVTIAGKGTITISLVDQFILGIITADNIEVEEKAFDNLTSNQADSANGAIGNSGIIYTAKTEQANSSKYILTVDGKQVSLNRSAISQILHGLETAKDTSATLYAALFEKSSDMIKEEILGQIDTNEIVGIFGKDINNVIGEQLTTELTLTLASGNTQEIIGVLAKIKTKVQSEGKINKVNIDHIVEMVDKWSKDGLPTIDASNIEERLKSIKDNLLAKSDRGFLSRFSAISNIEETNPALLEAKAATRYTFTGMQAQRMGIDNADGIVLSDFELYRLEEKIKGIANGWDISVQDVIRWEIQQYEDEMDGMSSTLGGAAAVMVSKLSDGNSGAGYGERKELIRRLLALQAAQQRSDWQETTKRFFDASKTVADWIKNASKTSNGNLQKGALDRFKTEIIDKAADAKKAAALLEAFMIEVVSESEMFGTKDATLRPAQVETVMALMRNENIAMEMAGGKSAAYTVDVVLHRIMYSKEANIEILVGNEDPSNFTSKEPATLLRFVGMEVANLSDYKTDQGSNVEAIEQIYNDPDTVVVVTPTQKAHMLNEAYSKNNRRLSNALNSVTRVMADEIHLWALTRTAAVIGENNEPPSVEVVEKMLDAARQIHADEIIAALDETTGKLSSEGVKIQVGGRELVIKQYETIYDADADLINANGNGAYGLIAVIGHSADRQIKMSETAKKAVNDANIDNNIVDSMLRGIFAQTEQGGMGVWDSASQDPEGKAPDFKVKPMGATLQTNMVISDINYQMAFAMKYALQHGTATGLSSEIVDVIQKMTQTSSTSISTSLASLYSNAAATILGGSGTVTGLEQLIISRSGAAILHNITGETVDIKSFETLSNQTVSEVVKKVLQDIQGQTNGKRGSALKDALFLAKTDAHIAEIIASVKKQLADINATAENYEVYVFAGQEQGMLDLRTGKITSTTDKLSDIVGKKNPTGKHRIVISNEFGETGIDYRGQYELALWDAELMSNADLAQALKRVGRSGDEYARYIVFDNASTAAQINTALLNPQLVYAMEQLFNGSIADGRLKNAKALGILEKIQNLTTGRGNKEISINDLKNIIGLTENDIIEFASNIMTLYDVNSSVRFALQDAVRDRMLLSILRELEQIAQPGEDLIRVKKELNDALATRQGNPDFSYKTAEEITGNASDNLAQQQSKAIQDIFYNVSQEALRYLHGLEGLRGVAGLLVSSQIKQIELAQNFTNLPAIKNKGLADAIDITEFMQIISSYQEFLLPVQPVQQAEALALSEALADISEAERPEIEKALTEANLITIKDGKAYIEQGAGRTAVELIRNNANSDKAAISKIIGILLTLLLSGAAVPPEEKEEIEKLLTDKNASQAQLTVGLAKALQSAGITNINNVINLINGSIANPDVLNGITVAQLKNIINAAHPQGLAENFAAQFKGKVLPSAQSIALLRLTNPKDEIVAQYDSFVANFYRIQAQQFALTASEKAQALKERYLNSAFAQSAPVAILSAAFDTIFGGVIRFLPKLPLINVFSHILPFGGEAAAMTFGQMMGSTFNSVGSIAAADILMPQNQQKQSFGIIDKILTAAFSIGGLYAKMRTSQSFRSSANKMDKLTNPKASEAFKEYNMALEKYNRAEAAGNGINVDEAQKAVDKAKADLAGVYAKIGMQMPSDKALAVINKLIEMSSESTLKNFTIADTVKFDDKTIEKYETLFAMLDTAKGQGVNFSKDYNFKEFEAAVKAGDYVRAQEILVMKSDSKYYELIKDVKSLTDLKEKEMRDTLIKDIFKKEEKELTPRESELVNRMAKNITITMKEVNELAAKSEMEKSADVRSLVLQLINPTINSVEDVKKIDEYYEAVRNINGEEAADSISVRSLDAKTDNTKILIEGLNYNNFAEYAKKSGKEEQEILKELGYKGTEIENSKREIESGWRRDFTNKEREQEYNKALDEFINGLSIAVLSDTKFIENMVKTVNRKGIEGYKFFTVKGLNEKINDVYKNKEGDNSVKAEEIAAQYNNMADDKAKVEREDKVSAYAKGVNNYNDLEKIPEEYKEEVAKELGVDHKEVKDNYELLKLMDINNAEEIFGGLSVQALSNNEYVESLIDIPEEYYDSKTTAEIVKELAAKEALDKTPLKNVDGIVDAEKGVVNNCFVIALNKIGLVSDDRIVELSVRLSGKIAVDYGNEFDNRKAAGLEYEINRPEVKIGTVREEFDLAAGTITKESVREGKINVGESGIILMSGNENETGHVIVLKGIGDKGVATYIDEKGNRKRKAIDELIDEGYVTVLSDQKTMEINEANNVVNAVAASKTKEWFEGMKEKFEEADAKVVVEKLLEKIVDGYMDAKEIDRMVLIAVAAFASAGEMETYMGLSSGNYNKESVAEAAINKMGEAIYLEQKGEFTLEERDREISLIRIVTDILTAAAGDESIKELINAIKDIEGVSQLQALMQREIKVNRYAIAEAMSKKVSIDNNVMTVGDFEIDLGELKQGLEEKAPKFNMFSKKNEELMKLIAGGLRGQDTTALSPMMLRNTRAVAAAA